MAHYQHLQLPVGQCILFFGLEIEEKKEKGISKLEYKKRK
jgi:hypothetical protein